MHKSVFRVIFIGLVLLMALALNPAAASAEKVLNMQIDPVTVFHMIRLAETIGSIADHSENAGDMMRAMLAR